MSLCIVSCFVAFSGYYSSTAIIFLPINDSSVLLFITRFKRIPARDSGVIIIDTEKAIKRVLLIIIVESKRISRRCLEKTERIFIGQTKVTFPGISSVLAYARFCILFVRIPLGIALSSSPPLKLLINTVTVHSALCPRFGSASRNETSNNKQQQQQQTTNKVLPISNQVFEIQSIEISQRLNNYDNIFLPTLLLFIR